jgi:hypothetical protein
LASFGPLSQLFVKSTYINVLNALKCQATLNFSLNSQIKVESVKNTIFEIIFATQKCLKRNLSNLSKSQQVESALIGLKSVSNGRNKKKRLIFHAFK